MNMSLPLRLVSNKAPTVQILHDRLLASASATSVIRELFGDPVVIRRLDGGGVADAAVCARLEVDDAAEIVHRRVALMAAGQEISVADLWYVPGRLEPDMVCALESSDEPFGIIVEPLQPRRDILAATFGHGTDVYALTHLALLRRKDNAPIALVHEFYRSDRLSAD